MNISPYRPPKQSLKHFSRLLVDLLFPPSCAGCNRPGNLFCDHCAQAVVAIAQAVCKRCGRAQVKSANTLCSLCEKDATPVLTMARAAAFHSEPLRAIIHQFKYGNRPELAEPLGRYLLVAFAAPEWRRFSIDVVAPVPMFEARQKERGYNQAELLARTFCYHTGLPLAPALLKRIRFTQAQVELNASERQLNVEKAFVADPTVKGKSILLIDDVYTTGATLRSCATSALENGADQVYGLTLAIPVLSGTPYDTDKVDSI